MRKVGLLALGAALGLVACTSILGDFSVGDGGTPDTGGGDVQGNDVVTNDAAPDVVDAGSDVQTVKLATCTLDTTKPTHFNWPSQGTLVDDGDRVFVFQIPQKNRLFVQHNNIIYYADFNDNDQTVQLSSFPANGQIINSAHVTTPTGAGTLFLLWDYNTFDFSYIKWPDTPGAPPTVGSTLVSNGKLNGTPVANFPIKGSITAIDWQSDDLLFALEYTFDTQGQTYQFATGHFKGGNLMGFGVIDTNQGPDLGAQMISHDQSSAYFWVQPGGNGNTPNGPAPLYVVDIPNWQKSNVVQYQPQTGFYVPFGMANGSPGNSDVAFLEGDLSNQNAIPFMHSQSIATGMLPSFKPQNVPGAQVPISGLPFNKSVSHWSSYPSEDDFIGAGRPLANGTPGVNIVWFDSKGNARALVSESDGGGGFPSIAVDSVDMTLTGAPTLVFSAIRAAWIEGQGQQQDPKVISMAGSCSAL